MAVELDVGGNGAIDIDRGGTNATTAAAARTSLGLEIGADVEPAKGDDDNFVTDAEKTVIGNTSGTNTGDQTGAAIKGLYEAEDDTNAYTDAEKSKLSGIATSATANSADATLLARANHTGTQTLSTISDAGTAASRAAEDTLTDGSNLPDGAAIKAYGDANWGGGGGYTNLTGFIDQTAWRLFYSDTDGDVTELALGADGTVLTSNGATSAPTFETVATGGTDDQTAAEVSVDDAGGLTTQTNVEAYLAENRTAINLNTAKTSFDSTSSSKLDAIEAGATADQTAAEVPVTDTGDNYTATNVETVLAEVAAKFGDYALTDSLATYISSLDLDLRGDVTVASANSFTMGILTFTDTNLSPTSVGQFRYDNTITGLEEGGFVYHNGTELRYFLDFATLPTVEGSVPRYNATTDKWVPEQIGPDVYTYSANQTLTAAQCYNSIIYVTAAATITLPAVVTRMNLSVIVIGDVEVSIDPNSSDLIVLDGTALDDGDKITSPGDAGDIAVITYYSASGFYASTNSWTDGGA